MRSLRSTPHTRRVVAVLISSLALISAMGALINAPGANAAGSLARSSHLRPFEPAPARWSGVLSDQVRLPSLSASSGPFGFGSALVGSAPVGNGPDFTAVDPATHTL